MVGKAPRGRDTDFVCTASSSLQFLSQFILITFGMIEEIRLLDTNIFLPKNGTFESMIFRTCQGGTCFLSNHGTLVTFH